MLDLEHFWAGRGPNSGRAGVDEEQFVDWETEFGVRFPAALRLAYARQDGGPVRNAEMDLHPLVEICLVDDDFWRFDEIPPAEARDHSLVIILGAETASGGQFLLNYNQNGPRGEPSLYVFYNDGTGASRIGETVDAYFERCLKSDSGPAIDWDASIASIEIIVQENLELASPRGARVEQVLGRTNGGLVLLVRQTDRQKCEISKTFLPLPLDPDMSTVEPCRPAPKSTFALTIHPDDSDGIIHESSTQLENGQWQNTTTEGVPVCVDFESAEKAPLERIRILLLGVHDLPAKPVRARKGKTASRGLAALSPADRLVASLLASRKTKTDLEAKIAANPTALTNNFLRIYVERADAEIAQAIAAGAPANPDPETIRRVNAALGN
jgi:hypothetical protein